MFFFFWFVCVRVPIKKRRDTRWEEKLPLEIIVNFLPWNCWFFFFFKKRSTELWAGFSVDPIVYAMELSKKFTSSFTINFFVCLFVWITNAMNMTRLRICPIIQNLSSLIFFFCFVVFCFIELHLVCLSQYLGVFFSSKKCHVN